MLNYFPKSNQNLILLIAALALFGPYGALAIVAFLSIPLALLVHGSSLVVVVLANLAIAGVTCAALVALARRQQGYMARIAAYGASVVRLIALVFQIAI
ncbi:MAG: hypothetical protein ACP5O6_10675, partial [Candidatus Baltobacteraceae bacterium]